MKKLLTLIGVAALLATTTMFTGCASAPKPEQLATYLADARDLAELGTTAALLENPGYRTELTISRDSLKALEALPADKVTVDSLLAALKTLPLDKLQSDKGKIYVTGGRILVRRFVSWATDPEIDVGNTGLVQKFSAAMREGMDAALK